MNSLGKKSKSSPLGRLLKAATGINLARIYRRRLTKSERAALRIEGVRGILPSVMKDHPELHHSYKQFGWLGIIDQLTLLVNEEKLDGVLATHCIQACSWFWHLGWGIERCTYADHRGGWWYVHRPRGRRPKACPLHAKAARQHRWEISASQKKSVEVRHQEPK